MPLMFVSPRNPIHRIEPRVLALLEEAQASSFDLVFPNASEFLLRVFADLRLDLRPTHDARDQPASAVAELKFNELQAYFTTLLNENGITGTAAALHSSNLAQRAQLVRAFSHPDRAVQNVSEMVVAKVADFPRVAEDIERGRNAGDVLDPFILAATQTLLYAGDFENAIGATVAHKALMIIEGMMGHLHEDILGEMRGNIRAPEPRGFNQELMDPFDNPFPGADVVQPPANATERLRFHQVKSKTGTVKGGDGGRLGRQLETLGRYYDGDTFYDSLIGNTLRGHRSMGAVLVASPSTVVTVGEAAFRELTRSEIGPELLLRVYQNAFSEAAAATGYNINDMATVIMASFQERAAAAGEGYLEVVMHNAVNGAAELQDSRFYQRPQRAVRR